MLEKLLSFILIASLSASSFANVGEQQSSGSETSAILTALSPEFLETELNSVKNEHEKINSWKDLKNTLETLQPEDQSFLMTKIGEWEKEPFSKPLFQKTDSGFVLKDGEQQIKFDLFEGTLSYQGKNLSLQGKKLKDVYNWLTTSAPRTSYMSFIISDAHAIAPLVIGLIAFVITSVGMLWNNSCKKSFMRTENRVNDLYSACNWDLEEQRSSPEIRQLLKDINSTENSLLRTSGKTCEQQVNESHKWLFFLSCSENAAGICSKINKLSNCLTSIKNRGPINDSRIWMERPLPVRRNPPVRRSRGQQN